MIKKIALLNFLLINMFTNNIANNKFLKPLNLETAKKLVIEYYESGGFEKECKEIIDKAIDYLKQNEEIFNTNKTVIFDINDTVLSFYEKIKKHDFCYICAALYFNDLIIDAKIPQIKQVKRLYDYCIENSYHIFFLDSVQEKNRQRISKNLKLHGYKIFDDIIVQAESEFKLTIGKYKLAQRKKLISKGFDIVCCVGDQESDFEGGNTGHIIKIPNYLYSSY